MHNVSDVVLISIGTEILFGEIQDTNAPFLSTELKLRGARIVRIVAVPDDRRALVRALGQAMLEADLVITTGGLGPTDDDPTREGVSEVAGETPVVDQDQLNCLEAFFSSRGLRMPATNRKQAWKIPSAEVLENPIGTAPGWFTRLGSRAIVSIPGPPAEMKKMWSEQVLPRLSFSQPGFWDVTLHTSGIGESAVADQLKELTKFENPYVATYARSGGVDIRISSRAQSFDLAAAQAQSTVERVRSLFGNHIYGTNEDSLASAVGKRLLKRRMSLATVESVTGGLIADRLTDVPGSSEYFRGGAVAYTVEAKTKIGVSAELISRHGVVSEEVVRAMARCAREHFQVDWAVGTTGVAGPSAHGGCPPGHAWICVSGPELEVAQMLDWPGRRRQIKERVVNASLKLLFDSLSEQPESFRPLPVSIPSIRHSPLITTSRGEKQGSSGALRLFYAVKVPDFVRERLMRFQGELGNHWRPVAANQMHITLAFMGEVPENDLPLVIAAGDIAVATGRLKPFTIDLGETGAFPNTREPRVWFVEAKAQELFELSAILRENLKTWCDSKPFRPHLTLARRRSDNARFVRLTVDRQWQVDSIELIKSELKPAGSSYTIVKTFELFPPG